MTRPKALALEVLRNGDMVGCNADGVKILLVKVDDELHAYEDRCAHLGVRLSEGTLDGPVLTCRVHHWQYDARTGKGLNPKSVCLKALDVEGLRQEKLWCNDDEPAKPPPVPPPPNVNAVNDVRPAPRHHETGDFTSHVGPVLEAGETADAVVAAIENENMGVVVVDQGSYVRVLVPWRCQVTRAAIEAALGRPFCLPGDLELVMLSFKGRLAMTEQGASWAFRRSP